MKRRVGQVIWLVVLVTVLAAVLGACGSTAGPTTPTPGVGLANPASVNCVEQGGEVIIRIDGSGGEYGVCLFDDNRQCEEWAMFRGDCPVGGVRITGYITLPGIFCAISGGTYTITANAGTADEQGDCTLPDGTMCSAEAYFNRTCGPASDS